MNKAGSAMHRNAKVAIFTEPLWALFGTAALYYLPLLLKVNGLSNWEIGLLVSLNLYFATVFQILAGPITNRLGRKRATFLFDVTSWVVPMFIWGISGSFWLFLLAYLLNSTSKVVNVSFWLLATEETPEAVRSRVFAAIKVIILLAGLLVPMVGVCIAQFGASTTLKWLFVLGGVAMLAHNIIRNTLSTETDAGREAMAHHRGLHVLKDVWVSVSSVARGLKDPKLLGITGAYAFSALGLQLTVFQVVFLSSTLRMSSLVVGLVPAVAAASGLIVFLSLLTRRASRAKSSTFASLGAAAAAVGWILFALFSGLNQIILFFAVVLYSAGAFMVETYRETLVINNFGDRDRANVYAGVQTLTAIVTIPSGLVAAALFNGHPTLVFTVVGIVYACSSAAAAWVRLRFPAVR